MSDNTKTNSQQSVNADTLPQEREPDALDRLSAFHKMLGGEGMTEEEKQDFRNQAIALVAKDRTENPDGPRRYVTIMGPQLPLVHFRKTVRLINVGESKTASGAEESPK